MDHEVAVIGVGVHPWGRWGKTSTELGIYAAKAALQDASVHWKDIQLVSAAASLRNGYPGYVAAASLMESLGWNGAELNTSYGACSSGAQALSVARSKLLSGECELALVIGADTSAKGFLSPQAGTRPDDLDWVRYYLGLPNPVYMALNARRRMALYGATESDFSQIKVKNSFHGSLNTNARYRFRFSLEQVNSSEVICDPLRLFHVCATSDGAAAVVMCTKRYAKTHGIDAVYLSGVSVASPIFPRDGLAMPYLASDSKSASPATNHLKSIVERAYAQSNAQSDDVSFVEAYDLCSATELDWYEHIGLCKQGDAEKLLRDGVTRLGGRVPVNPSGGLASFGEAMSAQVLAQTCELVLQLRSRAGSRQVENAKLGLAVSQGVFGHGAAIILKR